MILRGLVRFSLFLLPCLLILLVFLLLTVEGRVGSYDVWDCCAPSLPLDTAAFSPFLKLRGGYDLTGSVTVVPPPSPLILLYYIVR